MPSTVMVGTAIETAVEATLPTPIMVVGAATAALTVVRATAASTLAAAIALAAMVPPIALMICIMPTPFPEAMVVATAAADILVVAKAAMAVLDVASAVDTMRLTCGQWHLTVVLLAVAASMAVAALMSGVAPAG